VEIRTLIAKMALDDEAGRKAPEELAKIGAAAVPRLIEALSNQEARVRYRSVAALGNIGDARACGPIMEALRKDKDARVRQLAVWYLGQWFDREEVRKAVLQALQDEDSDVCIRATMIVEANKYAGAVPSLTKLLESKDGGVRYGAVRAIAEIQGEKAIELLKKVLQNDNNPEVRAAAVHYLGQWFDRPEIRDLIVGELDDKDKYVRAWAVRVVGEKRYEPALPKIMPLLQDTDEKVRYDALAAVAAIKGKESIELLKDVMKKDTSPAVRESALRSCTTIDPPTPLCFEVLHMGLGDPELSVRELAFKLLTKAFEQENPGTTWEEQKRWTFGYLPAATAGDREKATWEWGAWYRANKNQFKIVKKADGRLVFVAPEAKKPETPAQKKPEAPAPVKPKAPAPK
jgi:HEAT repeat protein